jgi:serine protease Do
LVFRGPGNKCRVKCNKILKSTVEPSVFIQDLIDLEAPFMLKIFAVILCNSVCAAAVFAQAPSPQPRAETRVFSMAFGGDGGYLGVQTTEVTKDNFGKFGLREVRGVAIEKVVEGSPAAAAGLQTGDVIVRFNGEEVTSVRKLTRLIGEVDPDHQARVTVIRGGSERDLTATLGKRPTPKFEEGSFAQTFPRMERVPMPPGEAPRVFSVPAPNAPDQPFVWRTGSRRQIGVGITPLTKQLAEHFGVDSGIMISDVRKDSPADKAGLKAGDIIVEVEGKPVDDQGDVLRAISEKKEGDVSLTIVRDRNRQTIRVTPEEVKGGFDSFFEFPDGDGPGGFKMMMPAAPVGPIAPAAPVPLNRPLVPGRVI